jgi:hypothetical protein
MDVNGRSAQCGARLWLQRIGQGLCLRQ